MNIMPKIILSLSPLLLGMALLMLGNGSLPTVLAIHLTAIGEPFWLIGLVMAQYYLGFVLGTVYCHKLILSVGHIRAFAAFGSTMSAVTLGHAFIFDPWIWAIFRFAVGACAVGMIMCVESWLNTRTDNNNRGQVFALYFITIYLFSGVGQFLIQIPDESGFVLFVVISILMSLSIVPIAVTRVSAPTLPPPQRFDFVQLWQTSPTGMATSMLSGLILGAFYTLGPVFAQLSSLDRSDIALFMSAVMIGGLVIQWPIGKLSDGRDRRAFLFYINLILAGVCALLATLVLSGYGLIGGAIIFGGLSSTLYPLSVAYTNDFLDPEDLVPAAGGLVMAFGIGAIIGPPIAALVVELLGAGGLFVFCGAVGLAAAALIFWRMRQREAPPVEDQVDFQTVPRTSPIISKLDPRGNG